MEHQGSAGHGGRAGMGMRAGLVQHAQSVFGAGLRTHYEIECLSPRDGERNHYLDMLAEAEQDRAKGNIPRALMLERTAECLREIAWRDDGWNLVVNVGLDDLLDKRFKASSYSASDFVMLTDGTPTIAAGDTMSSHVGWVEVVAYTEGTRPALTLGTVASQSVDNSASKASFAINTNSTTVGGAAVTTISTKSGTTGILYGAAAFTGGDKATDSGDTLSVTVTLTAAAA